MCKVMEDMRYESAVENAKEIAIRMIKGESGKASDLIDPCRKTKE